jgi:hypothetical protein
MSAPRAPTGKRGVDPSPIALLEATRRGGKTWEEVAPRYGVTNPDPPWKTSLHATCECLAVAGALDALERRRAEDWLAESVYAGVPAPERQLLSLVHTMVGRGLLSEDDLARHMKVIRARLETP